MKRIKYFLLTIMVSGSMLLFAAPARAFAVSCDLTPGGGVSFLAFPTWYKYLQGEQVAGKCTPIINASSDVLPIVAAIVEILLRLIGLAAIAYVVYGGFKYVTSQGQPDATKQARQTIQNAIIGIIISLIASVVVSFVGNNIK